MKIEFNKPFNGLRDDIESLSAIPFQGKFMSFSVLNASKKLMQSLCMSFFVLGALNANALDLSMKPISDKLKFQADENKWIKIGAGYRGTGIWTENIGTGNINEGRYSNDNARIYLNGQFGPYLKFEVNTECYFCNNTQQAQTPECRITFWTPS